MYLTQGLVTLNINHEFLAFQTLCLRHGYAGSIGGATPGKKIMQLRVISYNNITDLRNGHILVTGERDPGFFK